MPFEGEKIERPSVAAEERKPEIHELKKEKMEKVMAEFDTLEGISGRMRGTIKDLKKKFPTAEIRETPRHGFPNGFELVISSKEGPNRRFLIAGDLKWPEGEEYGRAAKESRKYPGTWPEEQVHNWIWKNGKVDAESLGSASVIETREEEGQHIETQRRYGLKTGRFPEFKGYYFGEEDIITYPDDPKRAGYRSEVEKDLGGDIVHIIEEGYPRRGSFSESWIDGKGRVININDSEEKMIIGEPTVERPYGMWGIGTISGAEVSREKFWETWQEAKKSGRKRIFVDIEELREKIKEAGKEKKEK